MAHRTFHLTEIAANALLAAYHATNNGAYRTRLQAVRLYGLGYTPAQIAHITACPRSTLLVWCRLYRAGGLKALADKCAVGNRRKLTAAQLAEIRRTLYISTPRSRFGPHAATDDGLAWTAADLQRLIKDDYAVEYQRIVS